MLKKKEYFVNLWRKLDERFAIKESDEQHVCLNCGRTFKGNYCNNCGQSANVQRISAHSIFKRFASSFFYVDSKLLYGLLMLFVRPGWYIKGYIDGQRVMRINPITLLFILSAIYTIFLYLFPSLVGKNMASHFFDLQYNSLNLDTIKTYLLSKSSGYFFSSVVVVLFKFLNLIKNNVAAEQIVIAPVCALASLMAFRKANAKLYHFNFSEFMVIRLYLACVLLVISMLFNLEHIFHGLLSLIFMYWAYMQIFRESKLQTLKHFLLMFVYMYYIMFVIALPLIFFLTIFTYYQN